MNLLASLALLASLGVTTLADGLARSPQMQLLRFAKQCSTATKIAL